MRSESRSRARREVGLLGRVTSELDLPPRWVLASGTRTAAVETTRFEVGVRGSPDHAVCRAWCYAYPGAEVSVMEHEGVVSNEDLRRALDDLARGPLAHATGDSPKAFEALGYDDAFAALHALVALEEVPTSDFAPAARVLADIAGGVPLEWALRRLSLDGSRP